MLDIPLCFETGATKAFDAIVVASAPADVQRERVLARPNMTEVAFEAILAKQVPDAAKRAGVTKIVKLAGMMTDPNMRIPAQHGIAERYLQDSGTAWTIVRPNFFMQNLLNTAGAVKGQGKMMMPFDPDVPIGMIDARDSAAVCATALTEDGYAEKLLEVTGALVTLNDCAAALSAVLGTDVPYVQAPLEMVQKMAMDNGAPDWAAEHIGNIVKDIEAGTMSRDTGTVAEILGRPARTVGEFLADHASVFKG